MSLDSSCVSISLISVEGIGNPVQQIDALTFTFEFIYACAVTNYLPEIILSSSFPS